MVYQGISGGFLGVKAGGVIFPHEPRQKNKQTTYFLFYWLFSRDPYFMVSEITPIYLCRITSPIYPKQLGSFHCLIGFNKPLVSLFVNKMATKKNTPEGLEPKIG